jgi:uncharacterized protein YoxC
MRDEEKLLRIKINELEKKKNQYSQDLDMKQRTIQQLKVAVIVVNDSCIPFCCNIILLPNKVHFLSTVLNFVALQ